MARLAQRQTMWLAGLVVLVLALGPGTTVTARAVDRERRRFAVMRYV